MKQPRDLTDSDISAAVSTVAQDLVSLRRIGGSSFLNLPLLYPDGSCVTVKIDRAPGGVRVSDNGFAYREIRNIGADGRAFNAAAKWAKEFDDVVASNRMVFVDATADEIYRAVCDVAAASWRIADRVFARRAESYDQEGIEGHLQERLSHVFGPSHIHPERTMKGFSASEWEVSAIVEGAEGVVVFQAVPNHANSIYRTSTAFRDLASLRKPPRLIAVVPSIEELGSKLTLLTQAQGKVIGLDDPDTNYQRAAA